jgi:hypothetical protein
VPRLLEIKTLLDIRDTGQCPCAPAEELLRTHIAEIVSWAGCARCAGSPAGHPSWVTR